LFVKRVSLVIVASINGQLLPMLLMLPMLARTAHCRIRTIAVLIPAQYAGTLVRALTPDRQLITLAEFTRLPGG